MNEEHQQQCANDDCKNIFFARRGKKYCSNKCRSWYNAEIRDKNVEKETLHFLRKNKSILLAFENKTGKITLFDLQEAGFNENYACF